MLYISPLHLEIHLIDLYVAPPSGMMPFLWRMSHIAGLPIARIGLRDSVAAGGAIVTPSPPDRPVIETCLLRASLTRHSDPRSVRSLQTPSQPLFSFFPWLSFSFLSSECIVHSICNKSADLSVADCAPGEFMWRNLRKCIGGSCN